MAAKSLRGTPLPKKPPYDHPHLPLDLPNQPKPAPAPPPPPTRRQRFIRWLRQKRWEWQAAFRKLLKSTGRKLFGYGALAAFSVLVLTAMGTHDNWCWRPWRQLHFCVYAKEPPPTTPTRPPAKMPEAWPFEYKP